MEIHGHFSGKLLLQGMSHSLFLTCMWVFALFIYLFFNPDLSVFFQTVFWAFLFFKTSSGQFYLREILCDLLFTSLFWHASNDTRITWVNDSRCAYFVVFPTCCAQFSVIATLVIDTSFGQAWCNNLFQISSRLGSCWRGSSVLLCHV